MIHWSRSVDSVYLVTLNVVVVVVCSVSNGLCANNLSDFVRDIYRSSE